MLRNEQLGDRPRESPLSDRVLSATTISCVRERTDQEWDMMMARILLCERYLHQRIETFCAAPAEVIIDIECDTIDTRVNVMATKQG